MLHTDAPSPPPPSVLSGLSWNGNDKKSGKPKWDRLMNVDILGVEFCHTAAALPANWNICTGRWVSPPACNPRPWRAFVLGRRGRLGSGIRSPWTCLYAFYAWAAWEWNYATPRRRAPHPPPGRRGDGNPHPRR